MLVKKISSVMMPVLLFAWEFPQIIVGLGVYAWMKARRMVVHIETENYRVFIETRTTGVSLGWFIFWTPAGNRFAELTNDCRMHEYGHARQSVMLGPLYLFVVGIPSLLRVIYSKLYFRKFHRHWPGYFSGFPENWADELGDVTAQGKGN